MISLAIFGPLLITIFIMLALLLPLIALIDILRSEFKGNDKIVWILVVLLANLVGTLIYFMIGRNQKIKNKQ